MDEERIEKIGLDPLKVYISLKSFSISAQILGPIYFSMAPFFNFIFQCCNELRVSDLVWTVILWEVRFGSGLLSDPDPVPVFVGRIRVNLNT